MDRKAGVAIRVVKRFDDRAQAGLGCSARKRVHGSVHRVHAGFGCSEDRRTRNAGCIMRVEVDRQTNLFFQGFDENGCRGRFQQTRHIFQADNVSPRIAQRFTHIDIVVQVVFGAVWIKDITGITDRAFTDFAGLDHGIHGDAHVFNPVQTVEHTENVNAGCSLADKFLYDIIGISRVADTIRPAQQHLGHNIRDAGAQIAQALPRTFLQKPIGHIKGRTAPAFHREQLWEVVRISRSRIDHIDGPHTRRQKGLVTISHGRIRHQQFGLARHPIGHGLRTFFFQKVPRAGNRFRIDRHGRSWCLGSGRRFRTSLDIGMTVHGDICDIAQDLGPAIAPRLEIEELGRRIDKFRCIRIVEEGRVLQQVDHEGNIS